VANLVRDWGRPARTRGLATAATLQALRFPAGKCFTALPQRAKTNRPLAAAGRRAARERLSRYGCVLSNNDYRIEMLGHSLLAVATTMVLLKHLTGRPSMCDVTRILSQIESGDPSAAEQLLPLVYEELRKLAAAKMAQEKPDQTLQATALVHEAYVRLVDVEKAQHWNSRGHFFGAAAEAMRRILVEHARQKQGSKRGGDRVRVELDAAWNLADPKAEEILAINDALADLECESPSAAQLVKLRYFGGMTHQEAADCLAISRTTADRYWAYARAALFCALKDARR
jgi:RNA polymerase sigma factor (TIGR02999 family)